MYSDTKAKLNVKLNAPRNKIIIRLLILDSWRILKPKAVTFRNHAVPPSLVLVCPHQLTKALSTASAKPQI